MPADPPPDPDRVADDLWGRVRALAAQVERMRAAAEEEPLEPDDAARLARARLRLARAAERAQLADRLADRVAEVRARRGPAARAAAPRRPDGPDGGR